VDNLVVGSNRLSLLAAADRLRQNGYGTLLLSARIRGEASEVGRFFGDLAREMGEHHVPMSPPARIPAGGETTVTMTGERQTGRKEPGAALAAALERVRSLRRVDRLGRDRPHDRGHGGRRDQLDSAGCTRPRAAA
jgi:glycerate 2-kinase